MPKIEPSVRTRPGSRLARVVAALAISLTAHVAMPVPVAACDCMGPEPMAAYAGRAEWTIFSGMVQAPGATGVPVLVSRWFQGDGAAAIVWIQGTWGVGGAACETSLPPAGTEWIFVASRRETGEIDVNLCTPHAAVATETGAAMLTDAIATFGDGGGAVPAGAATETPAVAGQGAAASVALPPLAYVGGALAAAVVVVGAALALQRRRRPA